ncbi:MAG: hypothetical protein NTY01_19980 [Verrucomicrobia bacterium]|nr:hypothetical protein [Verrucomicrobiota bacterium]
MTLLLVAGMLWAEDGRMSLLKTETFDRDPGWEAHNNRITPKKVLMVKQDFGHSATQFAGKAAGEMGGRIQRSTTPASYADKIVPKTLDDKLTASGSFAITASQGGAGIFFGFFNSQQPGGSGRPRATDGSPSRCGVTPTRRRITARFLNALSKRPKLAFPTRPRSPWTSHRATKRRARPLTASACST